MYKLPPTKTPDIPAHNPVDEETQRKFLNAGIGGPDFRLDTRLGFEVWETYSLKHYMALGDNPNRSPL